MPEPLELGGQMASKRWDETDARQSISESRVSISVVYMPRIQVASRVPRMPFLLPFMRWKSLQMSLSEVSDPVVENSYMLYNGLERVGQPSAFPRLQHKHFIVSFPGHFISSVVSELAQRADRSPRAPAI